MARDALGAHARDELGLSEISTARPVQAALTSADLAEDPAVLEAIAARGSLYLRGQALAMGLVVLGERAPARWREEVRAILFVPERPYFR